ncbi:hypothetical protein C8F01DRAFT_1105818 [Mycena amicta]|nr:hypothetical protein C8F01DRAFT_1105818 [Mycena amicta]
MRLFSKWLTPSLCFDPLLAKNMELIYSSITSTPTYQKCGPRCTLSESVVNNESATCATPRLLLGLETACRCEVNHHSARLYSYCGHAAANLISWIQRRPPQQSFPIRLCPAIFAVAWLPSTLDRCLSVNLSTQVNQFHSTPSNQLGNIFHPVFPSIEEHIVNDPVNQSEGPG